MTEASVIAPWTLSIPSFAATPRGPATPSVWRAAPCAWLLVCLIATMSSLSALNAQAQAQDQTLATVRLDGRALFRLTESAGTGARARARQVEQRLAAALASTSQASAEVQTAADPAQMTIVLMGRTLLTVTTADATENGMAVEVLAMRWTETINTALARAQQRRVSGWGRFVAAVQAGVETAFARLLESAIVVIPRALAAFLVLALFWALANGVRWAMRVIFRHLISDLTVENLIKQIGYYTVWALGLLVAATAFGLDPETAATGLGLTSLALGFAMKDVLSNFVSGLLILTLRPFELGDQIVIGETEGTVEPIELRATMIRTYDGRMVSVPNSETFTSRITNNTASPVRRASIELQLDYVADLRAAIQCLADTASRDDAVLPSPAPSVTVQELRSDTVLLQLQFWTDSRRSTHVATGSRIRLAVVERLREQNIALPDSTLDVRIVPKEG